MQVEGVDQEGKLPGSRQARAIDARQVHHQRQLDGLIGRGRPPRDVRLDEARRAACSQQQMADQGPCMHSICRVKITRAACISSLQITE